MIEVINSYYCNIQNSDLYLMSNSINLEVLLFILKNKQNLI